MASYIRDNKLEGVNSPFKVIIIVVGCLTKDRSYFDTTSLLKKAVEIKKLPIEGHDRFTCGKFGLDDIMGKFYPWLLLFIILYF